MPVFNQNIFTKEDDSNFVMKFFLLGTDTFLSLPQFLIITSNT